MTKLEQYYNKFKEDHRLTTRHGIVEFSTSMHFIKKTADFISQQNGHQFPVKIADIVAGTG